MTNQVMSWRAAVFQAVRTINDICDSASREDAANKCVFARKDAVSRASAASFIEVRSERPSGANRPPIFEQ